MKTLAVCSSFPPVNVTAVHRTLAVCRKLCDDEHEVTVLTMPPAPNQRLDRSLSERLPPELKVLRVPPWCRSAPSQAEPTHQRQPDPPVQEDGFSRTVASRLRSWLSWWLRVPDTRTGWLVPAVLAGLRHARKSRPDVIYTTAPMWTCHLVGMALSHLLQTGWVADCRDPWHANSFRRFPFAAHRRVDALLEGRMMVWAKVVICNTDTARRDMARRYPRFAAKLTTIPNGYNSATIETVRRWSFPPANGRCRLIHAGSFYGSRSPHQFMRALAYLVLRRPELRNQITFQHVGPERYEGQPLQKLADELGISDMVCVNGPVSHRQALQQVYASDIAVVAGHHGPGSALQIPRKIYEYFGLNKPVLVTGGTCRAVKTLLNAPVSDGLWLVEGETADGKTLSKTLEQIVNRWQAGDLPRRVHFPGDFSDSRMAGRIEAMLSRAADAGKTAPPWRFAILGDSVW